MYRYSPVSEISGISRKRAQVLATLGIYSVEQFLDATGNEKDLKDIALKLGLSLHQLGQIRKSAAGEISALPMQQPRMRWVGGGVILLVFGVLFIATGAFVHMQKFTSPLLIWQGIHIYENHHEQGVASFSLWKVKITAQFLKTGHTRTKINIKRDWTVYDGDILSSFPQGFFLINQGERFLLEHSEAHLIHILKKSVPAAPGWITTKVAKETSLMIPMKISEEDDLENIVGQGFLFQLAKPTSVLPAVDPSNEYSLNITAQFVSPRPLSGYNRLTGGQVKVNVHAGSGEYEFGNIGKKRLSDVPLPGLYLFEKKRKGQNIRTEFFWEPHVQGQFTAPDNMIASKRFYESAENGKVISESFVYEVSEANWIPYLGAILGFPMCLAGWALVRKKLKRKANVG